MNKPLGVLLTLFLAWLLAACSLVSPDGQPGSQPTATNRPTRTPAFTETPGPTQTPTPRVIQGTVTIWHSWDEPKMPALVQIIQDFQALYPDVSFDVLYVPLEALLPRFETAVREGGGPALLLGPAEWGPGLYDAGYLTSLNDLVSPDLPPTLNQAALGSAAYRDDLIGLPYAIEGVVLYRNKRFITERPVRFSELASLATGASRGDVVGAVLERSVFFSAAHLHGLGGQLMGPEGEPAFNDEAGLEWITLLREFESAGATEYFTDNDLNLFREGRAGFIIEGTWNMTSLAEALGENTLGIDPWPAYGSGYLSGFVRAESLFLSARTLPDNVEASWLFAEFLLAPESQARLAEVGLIPAATDVAVEDPLLAEAMVALAGGVTYPVVPEMIHYTAPLDAALRSIFFEGVAPEVALEAAQEAIRLAIESARTEAPTEAPVTDTPGEAPTETPPAPLTEPEASPTPEP